MLAVSVSRTAFFKWEDNFNILTVNLIATHTATHLL